MLVSVFWLQFDVFCFGCVRCVLYGVVCGVRFAFLLAACCLLVVVCCLLFDVICVSCFSLLCCLCECVCCLLFVVRYVLIVVCCSLFAIC